MVRDAGIVRTTAIPKESIVGVRSQLSPLAAALAPARVTMVMIS
jgi:hypothetical protein